MPPLPLPAAATVDGAVAVLAGAVTVTWTDIVRPLVSPVAVMVATPGVLSCTVAVKVPLADAVTVWSPGAAATKAAPAARSPEACVLTVMLIVSFAANPDPFSVTEPPAWTVVALTVSAGGGGGYGVGAAMAAVGAAIKPTSTAPKSARRRIMLQAHPS